MKVMICGICGGTNIIGIYGWASGYIESYKCRDCDREIIPLVTPQEAK